MAKQLTERQQEVADLVKQGKKAKEIGTILGISENAVYQQLRKIRAAGGARGTSRTAARKPAAKPTPAAAPAAAPQAPEPVSPDNALSARRREIEAELKATTARKAEADRTYAALVKECEQTDAALHTELERIKNAQQALDGKLAPPAPKPRSRPSRAKGSGSKPKGASAQQTPPQAAQSGNGSGAAPAEQPAPAAAPQPAAA